MPRASIRCLSNWRPPLLPTFQRLLSQQHLPEHSCQQSHHNIYPSFFKSLQRLLSGCHRSIITYAYLLFLSRETSTYGHSQLKTGHPVRSAIHKQLNGRLVLRWVTTWESLLLYVLCFCWQSSSFARIKPIRKNERKQGIRLMF